MKDVLEYLKDPMSKGVYRRVYQINFERMIDIYKEIAEDKEHPGYSSAKETLEDTVLLYEDEWFAINFG